MTETQKVWLKLIHSLLQTAISMVYPAIKNKDVPYFAKEILPSLLKIFETMKHIFSIPPQIDAIESPDKKV